MSADAGARLFDGSYNDGRTAQRIAAAARLVPGHLEIVDATGLVVDRWDFAGIELVPRAARGDQPVLQGGAGGAARFTPVDARLVDELRAQGAALAGRSAPAARSSFRLAAWIVVAVASIAIVMLGLVPLLAREVAAILPDGLERRVGDRYVDVIAGTFADRDADPRLCEGVEGRVAIDRLMARLQTVANVSPAPRVAVVAGSMVNAFAVPGSRLVVMRGLIEAVEGPDELAAVLAHELGHAVHRHPTEAAIRHGTTSFVIGLVMGDAVGISVLGTLAGQLMAAAHSREAEREADATGLRLLDAAGLRGDGFARFMSRVARQQRAAPGLLSYFESHPPSEDRAARAGDRARGAAAMTATEWEAVRRICASR